jgi:hypothetical protein
MTGRENIYAAMPEFALMFTVKEFSTREHINPLP